MKTKVENKYTSYICELIKKEHDLKNKLLQIKEQIKVFWNAKNADVSFNSIVEIENIIKNETKPEEKIFAKVIQNSMINLKTLPDGLLYELFENIIEEINRRKENGQ